MENAKNTKNESKVKKGEELLAVLTEILNDNANVLKRQDAIEQKLDDIEKKLVRALPPSPGRFTRL